VDGGVLAGAGSGAMAVVATVAGATAAGAIAPGTGEAASVEEAAGAGARFAVPLESGAPFSQANAIVAVASKGRGKRIDVSSHRMNPMGAARRHKPSTSRAIDLR
jgi:hypothetical protein